VITAIRIEVRPLTFLYRVVQVLGAAKLAERASPDNGACYHGAVGVVLPAPGLACDSLGARMKDAFIAEVLRRPEIADEPPILIDIGASGALHPEWKPFADCSIAVAFDPDDREMGYAVKESSSYKRLYLFNCVVTDEAPRAEKVEFYLTRSPYCSSVLEPRSEALGNWAFSELFAVEKKAPMQARTLSSILTELKISRVDWFKTDSQGVDLRLFQSMGEDIVRKVLAAEFEPGILDAYRGEDKLWSLMKYMDAQPFWMSDMTVKGTQRIRPELVRERFPAIHRRYFQRLLKTTPGWAEVLYLNTFREEGALRLREYLLGWVFAIAKEQHGFAIDVALAGEKRFGDPLFRRMADHATDLIKRELYKQLPQRVAAGVLRRLGRLGRILDRPS
jgi:hypothetical protein